MCIRVCFGYMYMCECIRRYVYIYMHVWLGSLYTVYACVAGISEHGICMFGRECVDMVYALLFGGGSVYMTCVPLIGGLCSRCMNVRLRVCVHARHAEDS